MVGLLVVQQLRAWAPNLLPAEGDSRFEDLRCTRKHSCSWEPFNIAACAGSPHVAHV